MGVLEDVVSMKGQGFSEEDIANNLREKGVSPKEIRDALSQLKIKNAVYEYGPGEEESPFKNQSGGEYPQKTKEAFEQESPLPQPGQNYGGYSPQGYSQQDDSQQGYAPQESYETYSSGTGMNTNNMIEISEQVFSEKIKALQGELNSFNEFKSLNQIRLENLNERLKRIETVFDKLQITILEKIGSYGQNLEAIKKEMNMVQNSFSKIVEPMVERAERKQEENSSSLSQSKEKKSRSLKNKK
ncbi:MAG: hypothetical protein ABIH28_02910 [archaeon]